MSGTAKWLIVGSVVVIALAALVALGFFTWMVYRSPMLSGVCDSWGMPFMSGPVQSRMGSWRGGRGMMGDFPGGKYGRMGDLGDGYAGMMGGCGYGSALSAGSDSGDVLTLEVVEGRLDEFLGGRSDLAVAEIMIFDNHAYAEIVEKETGVGAMEVLVDPITLAVYPEHGPNMMWNLKYGGMHGGGMMGFAWGSSDLGEMTVSPEQAIEYAQAYLDRFTQDLNAADNADRFYGYYTIHTERNGEVVGMLSVNGYSGDIFPHSWHGTLLEMSETDQE